MNMDKVLINCTSHNICIFSNDREINIPSSGTEARIDEERFPAGYINGVPLNLMVRGDVINLPEPKHNVMYIVSKQVMFHPSVMSRRDLLAPDDFVYEKNGNRRGCKRLVGTGSMAAHMIRLKLHGKDGKHSISICEDRERAGVILLEARHKLACVEIVEYGQSVQLPEPVPSVMWILTWMKG